MGDSGRISTRLRLDTPQVRAGRQQKLRQAALLVFVGAVVVLIEEETFQTKKRHNIRNWQLTATAALLDTETTKHQRISLRRASSAVLL